MMKTELTVKNLKTQKEQVIERRNDMKNNINKRLIQYNRRGVELQK